MLTAEHRELRRTRLGASDIAGVCGLLPKTFGRSTPLAVYLDKIGSLRDTPNESMRWGSKQEEVIAEAYCETTGLCVWKPELVLCHPEYPWMGASLDWLAGLAPTHTESRRVMEAKTADVRFAGQWGEPGTDEIPLYYLVQVQQQMAVSRLSLADVAVLIGGNDFRVYTVPRNEQVIAYLIEIGAAFWKRVEERNPPEPDWSHPATPALIDALYRPTADKVVSLSELAGAHVAAYEALGESIREMEKQRAEAKARLVAELGDASVGLLPDGRQVTRKLVTRKSHVVEESTYPDLRIKKARRK